MWKILLTDRKFWAFVIGLAVMLLSQVFPSFALDQEAAIGLAIVVVAYAIGVAVDPGIPGWRGVLKSRKFWAALVGLIILVLRGFGISLPVDVPEDTIVWLCTMLGGLIAGFAVQPGPEDDLDDFPL